ncbi:glycosyltransferase family 4 protein [Chitinimonas lacunae]|uniref:Glycosyltransferase family 4 protein n=1 Tax=Chitinimonas lacunae TaxID=1963018 RepID=A0ABV8MQ77_9NEIS
MRLAYAYNEILPKRSAHDVYVARNAHALAAAGVETTLLVGRGGPHDAALLDHYRLDPLPTFRLARLPIVRRNLALPITLNAVFNWSAQSWLRRQRPDWLALSVIKQGQFHLARRISGIRYVYEVHELAWYPGRDAGAPAIAARLAAERTMLAACDLVTVTTEALATILRQPPYSLRVPIAVIPLATPPLLPAGPTEHRTPTLRLAYIGQLYREQGVELLLEALARTNSAELDVIGGKEAEVAALRTTAQRLGIADRVRWHGFQAPAALPALVAAADVCVAPFLSVGRMPYVAHTKLLEYIGWRRPVIAPRLPVVEEHFPDGAGAELYAADDPAALAQAIEALQQPDKLAQRRCEIAAHRGCLDWAGRSAAYLAALEAVAAGQTL